MITILIAIVLALLALAAAYAALVDLPQYHREQRDWTAPRLSARRPSSVSGFPLVMDIWAWDQMQR